MSTDLVSLRISLLLAAIPDPIVRNIVISQAEKRYFPSARHYAHFEYVTNARGSIANIQAAYQVTMSDLYRHLQNEIVREGRSSNLLSQQLRRSLLETVDEVSRSKIESVLRTAGDKVAKEHLVQRIKMGVPFDVSAEAAKLVANSTRTEDVVKLSSEINEAIRNRNTIILELESRQLDLAEKVRVQAQEFETKAKLVNERLKKASDDLVEIRRQLQDQDVLKDAARAKKLSTDLITGLQNTRTLSDGLKAALYGKLDSRVAAFQRTQHDLQLFKEIDVNRDGMAKAVHGYVGGMQSLMSNLGAAGIAIPEDAKKGVALASAAAGVAGQLSSGNYIGAVMGAMGALGIGGGGGGGESGQQQVLSGINQILQGQKIIIQKLEQVLATQQQILKGLAELSDQIERNQQEFRLRFDALDGSVRATSAAAHQLLDRPILRCKQPSEAFKSALNYEAIQITFEDKDTAESFSDCRKGLLSQFNSGQAPANLSLEASAVDTTLSEIERKARDARTAEFLTTKSLFDDYGDNAIANRILRRLRSPTPIIAEMDPSIIEPAFNESGLPLPLALRADAMGIDEVSLTRDVEYLLFANAIPQEVMNPDKSGRLLPPEQAVVAIDSSKRVPIPTRQGKHPDHPFRYALENSVEMIDTAIAQQAMLSGDATILMMVALGNKPSGKPIVLKHLATRQLFARNYVLYQLRKAAPGPSWAVAYNVAYTERNVPAMQAVVQGAGQVRYQPIEGGAIMLVVPPTTPPQVGCSNGGAVVPAGWSIMLSDCIFIPLPTPAEFEAAKLSYTESFYRLLALRERVIGALRRYDLDAPSMSLVSLSERLQARAFVSLKPFLSER